MLNYCFAGAERTRNCSDSALRDWKESIDDALTRNQRHLRRQFPGIGAFSSHRPFLHQCEVYIAGDCLYCGDRVVDTEGSGPDIPYSAADSIGNHDPVRDDRGFLNGADDVACGNLVPRPDGCGKFPCPFMIERGDFYSSGKQIAPGDLHDLVQGALNSVVDGTDQSGTQFHRQRLSGRFHRFARTKALCLLINLYGSPVTVHLDNFTDQSFSAYTHDIIHIRITHAFGDHKRAGNFSDCTCAHSICSPSVSCFIGPAGRARTMGMRSAESSYRVKTSAGKQYVASNRLFHGFLH